MDMLYPLVPFQLPKDRISQNLHSPFSSGMRSINSPNSLRHGLAMGSSPGSRSKEIVITDPYLDAITKETKARTQNRFSVSLVNKVVKAVLGITFICKIQLSSFTQNLRSFCQAI